MKLAFVDNLPVGGGLSRFSLLLCKSLVESDPSMAIDYYVHNDNLKHIPEITGLGAQVKVRLLRTTVPKGLSARVVSKIKRVLSGSGKQADPTLREIEQAVSSGSYDLAYFPSAHMMQRPDLKVPVVGTLHDFNWRYFFGRQIFPSAFVEMMDSEILKWMDKGWNICSSHDVVDEARKLYPSARRLPQVIPIAPVIFNSKIPEARMNEILRELKIEWPYIIFPGNFFPHKNHLNLFTAFSILRKRKGFEAYKLVLTGMNSEQVKRGVAEYRGVKLLTTKTMTEEFDVMGMGYQPNEVIDTLISKARLLVSPSIYEAICTPAMDAWSFGTPTAISDIPPFREHEKSWSIRSAFFDPMDPLNIADVLEAYLNDYDRALEDGRVSMENMSKYTWNRVAAEYLGVFQNAIKEYQ